MGTSRNKHMLNGKTKPYTKPLKETMRRKSEILSKAQAFWEIGMTETAQPLWLSAATYEEQIAPMLDALGRELEGRCIGLVRPRAMKRRGIRVEP